MLGRIYVSSMFLPCPLRVLSAALLVSSHLLKPRSSRFSSLDEANKPLCSILHCWGSQVLIHPFDFPPQEKSGAKISLGPSAMPPWEQGVQIKSNCSSDSLQCIQARIFFFFGSNFFAVTSLHS